MKIVIFGPGWSPIWRGRHLISWWSICSALTKRGHTAVFFQHETPLARNHHEAYGPLGQHVEFEEWDDIRPLARRHLSDADAAVVVSSFPDALAATALVLESEAGIRAVHALDQAGTVALQEALGLFDVVLRDTGGAALLRLCDKYGAKRTAAFHGCVDGARLTHSFPADFYRATVGYLGSCAQDPASAFDSLFLEPARLLPEERFLVCAAGPASHFPRLPNIVLVEHDRKAHHQALFASMRFSLSINGDERDRDWAISAALLDAASSGAVVLSDGWEGLAEILQPGTETVTVHSTEEVLAAVRQPHEETRRIGIAARERAFACHTADTRAQELEHILASRIPAPVNFRETPRHFVA